MIQAPKGTRDFYPQDMAIQNYIFEGWKQSACSYGYEEYESPSFENLDLYTLKSGEEIVSQLYSFKDKGNRDLALRPEMTPTLARMVAYKVSSLKLPLRWFSIPRLQRYERAQKGRLREFYQLNMDIIGCDSVWAEIDLLMSVIDLLRWFGLSQSDFKIGISDRRLFEALFEELIIPQELHQKIYSILDKKTKLSINDFNKEFLKVGLTEKQLEKVEKFFDCKTVDDLSVFSKIVEEQLFDLKEITKTFNEIGLGSYIHLDLSVVRGLAYYTGIVFEVFDTKKSMRAIAGGGRYQNLCGQLGKQEINGVGFGMGDVVLSDLLSDRKLFRPITKTLDYYIVGLDKIDSSLFLLAQRLRFKKLSVSHVLLDRKLRKQMSLAEYSGAKKVIFYSEERAKKNQYEVKNMETGEQAFFSLEQL